MRILNRRYPGNGDYPKTYAPVYIEVISKSKIKTKRVGRAYWSGFMCVPVNPFMIGYAKVISWSDKAITE
jgi:hypothetical protein